VKPPYVGGTLVEHWSLHLDWDVLLDRWSWSVASWTDRGRCSDLERSYTSRRDSATTEPFVEHRLAAILSSLALEVQSATTEEF
jgi:hypothetical protein